ncbi:hypothetical protein NGRA_0139 [Nosema granulosis]|uniref:Uncharacterized protein n=1 Tax=Nosema granulosis TaxID=83296 RepID=A0A9P6L0M4_9MICR|nr:hypothetical protein NGRA_0139 [Nosema granulosis]
MNLIPIWIPAMCCRTNHVFNLYLYTTNWLMSDKALCVFVLTFCIIVIFLSKNSKTLTFLIFNGILLAYLNMNFDIKTKSVCSILETLPKKEAFAKIYYFILSLVISWIIQLSRCVFEVYIVAVYVLLVYFVLDGDRLVYVLMILLSLYKTISKFRRFLMVLFISLYSSLIILICIESLDTTQLEMENIPNVFCSKITISDLLRKNIAFTIILTLFEMVFYYFDTEKHFKEP